jgi:metal-responsive CopG/Arc/MetJ family transcriptional regulator
MVIKEISLRIPEDTLDRLDRIATRKKSTRDDVLMELIQDYMIRKEVEKEIAELTLSYLGKKPRHGHSISQINAEKVAQAMVEAYGTDDIVEIIDASRWRGGSP